MTPMEVLAEVLRRYSADDREGFRALLDDAVVYREPAMGIETYGADRMCEVVFARKVPFPDLAATLGRAFTAGDLACQELVWDGHHEGPLGPLPDGGTLPPSGRTTHSPACMVASVRDGRLTGLDHYWDALGMLVRLGAFEGAPA
ncbi:MAG: ester cyclase [Thermoleophilia bacterium]|jgi:ketosteroid isomerase-like protein|nr:ester cyclase [Thermoleophilia bacterium]